MNVETSEKVLKDNERGGENRQGMTSEAECVDEEMARHVGLEGERVKI